MASSGLPQEANAIQDYDVLPDYATAVPGLRPQRSNRLPTEHVSSLRDNANHPWLSLVLHSRAASQNLAPHFTEGKPVEGRVLVDLSKPQRIESIIVTVIGQIVCNLTDVSVFYSDSKTLWKTLHEDAPSLNLLRLGKPKAGPESLLGGQHVWPFSFVLPREFQVDMRVAKENKLKSTEFMPPSLNGKGRHSSILYQVTLDVKRRGYFQGDSTLTCRFLYTPISKPGPASVLRNEAYADELEPLGPTVDTEGWKSLPEFQIRGTLFHNRLVLATCTFALAIPCSFARGSVAPCYLTIRCDDPQALELFSAPGSPTIRMRRKLKYKISKSSGLSSGSDYLSGPDDDAVLSIAVWKHAQEDPSREGSVNQRNLYGELSLPKQLVPSFSFGDFEVKYFVEIYPFNAAGFVPASQNHLLRTEIGITSHFEDSIRPRAYMPPGYIPN